MPIYEFYCASCHTIFSFFSPRVRTDASPACPRCGRSDLERKPSRFATLDRVSRVGDDPEGDPLADLDEGRLEAALETLADEAEGLEESEDPRAMGQLMRRFSSLTGLDLGDRMEDMVRRLESGEDPDALESEMEDADDSELDAFFRIKKAVRGTRRPPSVDDELYFL